MKVYRVRNDVNRFQYFLTETRDDEEKLRMDCSLLSENWVPPSVFIYKPMLQKGDFFNFGSSALICSPRATEVLYYHLSIAGELLPLPYKDETLTLLNVTECIDCLDINKMRNLHGGISKVPLLLKEYEFYSDRFSDSDLFKIPETHKGEILVVEGRKDPEDEFMHTVKSTGLRGLIFEKVWEQ